MSKIPRRDRPRPRAGHIPPATPPRDSEVVFCFRYIDFSNAKFVVADRDGVYLSALLDRLKNVCTMKVTEMFSGGRVLRCHKIDFAYTSEPTGFAKLPAHLRDQTAVQFQLTSNEHGRVHGFMIDNVFHVVWLDPQHALYP